MKHSVVPVYQVLFFREMMDGTMTGTLHHLIR